MPKPPATGGPIRTRQHQQVHTALQGLSPLREAVAAEIVFLEAVPLDHGAHGTVDHQYPFIQYFLNLPHNDLSGVN